jgi:23S rRNA pseudouridine955/2504/2580 synthase
MTIQAQHSPNAVRIASIDQHHDGQRLDNFLLLQLKGVPRSHVYRLLRSGQVRVNRGRKKPDYKLQLGDEVRIPPVRMTTSENVHVPDNLCAQLEAALLYEDDDLLAINKPAGIPVHAGSGIHFGVIEALKQLRPDSFIELVHRLDRDTSGCLLLAKNRNSLTALHRLLRREDSTSIGKHYLALVQGRWPGRMTVDAPLEKIQRSGEHRVEVMASGAHAISHFEALKLYADASLMQVRIETGRTHQIRVHATHAGHPIAGDARYGDDDFNRDLRHRGLKRLFLHASRLSLPLATPLLIEAPLPAELQGVLDAMPT